MTQDEKTIRHIMVLEDSWIIKTERVKQLLRMRNGASYREEIERLRQQITEIEEELLNQPSCPTVFFWEQFQQYGGEK